MFYRTQIKGLENWKKSPERKPLVIRGARQVGKTTLVNQFGKQFKQYIYLNLERPQDAKIFRDLQNLDQLIKRIFLQQKMQHDLIHDTLLFIDEIQEQPEVVNLLRYFKEEKPQLAVIAAGSMLETLLGKNLTFPVGRVEYKVLRPVSFEEYLIAMNEKQLLDEFRNIPCEKYAEPALIDAFHEYALLGGMPEIIEHYRKHRDITKLSTIYDSLITSYLQDAEKYAKNTGQLQLIRFAIHQAMRKAGKRNTFRQFGNSEYPSKAIAEVMRALEKTHLLSIMYPLTGATLPLQPNYKKTPRIQFLDTGIVNYFAGLQLDILGTEDLSSVYQGTLIEHLVGQELLSFQSKTLDQLHFWVRHKKQSDAEIDFIHRYKSKLIPIEVKSGAAGKLKSLQVFMDQTPCNFAIRFYAGSIKLQQIKTQKGKTFHLLNLPYFLSSKIDQYLDHFMGEITFAEKSNPDVIQEKAETYQKEKSPEQEYTIKSLNYKHHKILQLCAREPQKGKTLIEKGLELTYQSRNKRIYLKPLIALNLIEFTIKHNIKSKQQRYQITAKGLNLLK